MTAETLAMEYVEKLARENNTLALNILRHNRYQYIPWERISKLMAENEAPFEARFLEILNAETFRKFWNEAMKISQRPASKAWSTD